MTQTAELESAFHSAIAQVEKCLTSGMKAVGGEPAAPYLVKLEEDLRQERTRALARGSVDRVWVQMVVRSLVEWLPETELTLIAALGRIARAR